MHLLKTLNWRYAVKRFSDHKLNTEQLNLLLEATRLSPSAYGFQPYRLLVVEDTSLREQLVAYSYDQDKVLNSSHLIVFAALRDIDYTFIAEHMERLSAQRNLSKEARDNLEQHYQQVLVDQADKAQRQQWIREQTYLALGNFLTSAAVMEIDTCPMTGIVAEDYDRLLQLQDKNLTTIAIATLGHRHPQDGYATQAKVRLSMDELVLRVTA